MQTRAFGRPRTNPGRETAGRLALVLGMALALAAHAQNDFRPDRILIQPKAGVSSGQLDAFHGTLGTQVLRNFPAYENMQVLGLPAEMDVSTALQSYLESGFVDVAEPDFLLHPTLTPDDSYFLSGALWYLHNTGQSGGVMDADIDAPEAWDAPVSAGNIIVAIVDTGVRYTHQDLATNMWRNPTEIPGNGLDDDGNGYVDDVHGINAAAGTGDPADLEGHGTTVAGAAGAVGNNGLGTATACWSVRLMACRFYDDAGVGSASDAITCIDSARQERAHIINASWVSTNYSSMLYSAIRNCQSAGIILVAGAGNDGLDTDGVPNYPASYDLDNIVAVAATTRTDALASYSNYGATSVDLGAPGSEIVTTSNAGDTTYATVYGTSYCAPMASSVLALVRARYPSDTYLQIINRVYAAVDLVPSLSGKCVTGGRINLATAIGPSVLADFDASPVSGSPPLTVSFTDESFGAITNWSWIFGDGGVSSAQNPSHTYNSEGTFTTTLTVLNNLGQTSSKSTNITVIANYQVTNATYSWIDPAGMTALSLSNDGVSPAQALPITFRYYGRDYTQLYVGANGLIGLVDASLSSAANTDLPDAATPNNIICPFWDDLNPGAGGSVLIGTTGTAPNRKVVVSWVNVPYSGNPPASFTFQAVLEEGTHRILFQYQSVVSGHGPASAGQSATVGLENAAGTLAAKYSYNGSTLLANNTAIMFIPPPAVAPAGVLAVSPADGWSASGLVGGPFTPSSNDYTLTNPGGSTLEWSAGPSLDWVNVSPGSGTLAAGASATATVSITSAADILAAGSYTNLVSFVNTTTGNGNSTRPVSLTVSGLGMLAVSPAEGWSATGPVGGPFTPSSSDYALTNPGGSSLDWTASPSLDWLSVSPGSGTLAAGASATVTVSLTSAADSLAAGSYTNVVSFVNTTTGNGNTTCPVSLTVGGLGVLAVSPAEGWSATGPVGGPFTPSSSDYTLTNSGGATLDWTASPSLDWVSVSPGSGTLAVGANATLTVSLTSVAESLAEGSYANIVSFLNTTTGNGNTTRPVSLTVSKQGDDVTLSPLWRWSNPLPHGANIVDQDANLALTVQVGERGQIYLSDDWNVWIPRDSGTTAALRGVTFFGGRLVITGEAGTVILADDPWNFYRLTLGTSDWLESVAASSSLAVAVGDNAAIYTSTNAVDWQHVTPPFNNWLRSVACHGSIFVTVGEGGLIASSSSGNVWQARSSGTTANLNRVAWLGDHFLALGDGGVALSSTNGNQWSAVNLGVTNYLYAAGGVTNSHVAAGDLEALLSEDNGSWLSQLAPTLAAPAPAWTYFSALWNSGYYLLAGRTGMLVEGVKTNSAEPTKWQPLVESVRTWLWSVARTPTHYVAVGDRGTILSSPNGIDWDLELLPFTVTNSVLLGVGGSSNLLLAVGSQGTVLWGTNVFLWNELTPKPTINDLQGVCYDGGQFILSGGNSTILTSPNGTNWTQRTTPTTAFLMSVAAYPGGLVTVGEDGVILTSIDGGTTWTPQSSGTTNWLSQVRWLNDRLIAVGENGTILSSPDGAQWRTNASGIGAWLNAADFLEDTWFIVGNQGTVLSSTDSTNWVSLGTLTRKSLYGVTIHQGQLVTVGTEGVILRSQLVPDSTPIELADFSRASGMNVFLFTGAPDQQFRLQSSPELASWTDGALLEFLDSSGTLIYVEETGTNAPATEFYRARRE